MTKRRYNFLMDNLAAPLKKAEIIEGWHWCSEFDGLLVGPGMSELNFCSCWPKEHPVYKTAPKVETVTEGMPPF